MNFGLKGKVAIIGGSSKGLGKACAVAIAKEGASIVICSNDNTSLKETKKEIESLGVRVLDLEVDMSLESDNEKIIRETVSEFGRIDILVNNSGGPKPGTFFSLSPDDWDEAYNSVLKYNVRMIKGCIPYMEKTGWGRIINITSLAVKEPAQTLVLSNVFRAGVVSLAKSLSKDLISKGITINNICPGAFKTDRAKELLQKRADESGLTVEEIEEQTVRNFPQKRYQHPEELGDLVCFLVSERAASLTGTTIQIDGGISISLL
jgi:3-oxoacyl-[acyl-carrier protein] reductase